MYHILTYWSLLMIFIDFHLIMNLFSQSFWLGCTVQCIAILKINRWLRFSRSLYWIEHDSKSNTCFHLESKLHVHSILTQCVAGSIYNVPTPYLHYLNQKLAPILFPILSTCANNVNKLKISKSLSKWAKFWSCREYTYCVCM